jgi:surfeit locus 1 family protein
LVALGVWQLRRLAWKEAILARIEQSLKSEPGAYDFSKAREESEDAREFRRVSVHGFFLPNNTVKMLVPTPPYARGNQRRLWLSCLFAAWLRRRHCVR